MNMMLVQKLDTKTVGFALTALAGKEVLLQLLVDLAWWTALKWNWTLLEYKSLTKHDCVIRTFVLKPRV